VNDAELMQAVESRVAELERLPAGPRAAAQEAMRAVLDLHREALARVLGALRERGSLGVALTEHLARDPFLGSVLALHDLHPQDLGARVSGAIESVRPLLSLNGVDVRVEGVERGEIEVTLSQKAGCPSTGARMRGALEEALDRAAPDAKRIQVREEA
jgi:hypothetical protein